jgi:CDP-2,3-bis-(O-geranylgeranyl)-sn-glycerol synthase
MLFLQALYFALPIYLANMAPVLVKGLPFLQCPLDAGRQLRGKRLFGKNKTWRGLIAGSLMGILIVEIQQYLHMNTEVAQTISLLDYTNVDAINLGLLMGFGALLGDAVKSFFKRQLGKESGTAWPPFDQLDFMLMALFFTSFSYFPGWGAVIILLILTPFLHLMTNIIAHKIGLKEVPW